MLPFGTTQINLEGFVLSEISQTEKDKHYVITYMSNLKNKTNEYNKTKTDSDIENKFAITSGERKKEDRGRGLRGTNYYV